jgi:DNA polymerase-3 subunit gamma/tau
VPGEPGQQQETPIQEPPQRSLYRRHRPRTFTEVVGQDSVVRTLRNAVEQGKVHHAYLFVGSRGTGKTSMAKILAACLNCERGPTTEPCGVCASCQAIAAATSLDVIEMDAASNNSVEDIRELRERIAFAPVSGRHKVYILDEAHMLSQAAWNAFLKTLEEPPPGTVFVLATTEAQKVPATVVDRCHRFDFHRPSAEQIAGVIRRVAETERIEVPPEAVAAIARAAEGSFRDALGTLEQLVTYSGNEIALEDVLAVLGIVDAEALDEMLEAIARADAARVLLTISRCLEGGRDAGTVAAELEGRARDLLVVGTLGEVPAELSVTPEADARLAIQADAMPRATVVRLLELLARANEAIRAGADARTQLELALVKAASPQSDASTASLLARLERLESRVSSHAGNGAQPAAPSPPASRATKPASRATKPPSESERVTSSEPAPVAEPASSAPSPAPAAEPAPAPQPAPADEPAPAAVEPGAGDLEGLREQWPKALDAIRAENALLGALIAEAQPVDVDGDQVTLAFAPSAAFLKRKAEDRAHYATVVEELRRVTGRRVRLTYELRDGVAPPQHTPAEEELVARLVAELDAEELPAGELAE